MSENMNNTNKIFEIAFEALKEPVYCYDEGQGDILDGERFELLDLDYHCGATRIAIVLDDYVLKKPFNGFCEEGEDENGNPYVDCSDEEEIQNSCEIELNLYKLAVKEGVGKFFAAIEYLSDGIYKQERAEELVAWRIAAKNQTVEEIQKIAKEANLEELCDRTSPLVMEWLMETYSNEELDELQKFLVKYDINDLHAHNTGWVKGVLKFIDYTGTNESTSGLVDNARKEG